MTVEGFIIGSLLIGAGWQALESLCVRRRRRPDDRHARRLIMIEQQARRARQDTIAHSNLLRARAQSVPPDDRLTSVDQLLNDIARHGR